MLAQIQALQAFIVAHHALIVYTVSGALTALNLAIKIALYVHPVADWVALAEKRPRLAAIIRLSMALGINPVSVLQALVDLVRNEASKGTVASIKAVATSASKPLISAKKDKAS